MLVTTNDPEDKQFYITVLGKVEKVADISPRVVSLEGKPGETLTARVRITPEPAYPFSILGMNQEFSNEAFTCKLIPPGKGEKTWQIAITVTSQKPDSLYEIITLQTDNQYKPKLKVRAYAIYSEPLKEGTSKEHG